MNMETDCPRELQEAEPQRQVFTDVICLKNSENQAQMPTEQDASPVEVCGDQSFHSEDGVHPVANKTPLATRGLNDPRPRASGFQDSTQDQVGQSQFYVDGVHSRTPHSHGSF